MTGQLCPFVFPKMACVYLNLLRESSSEANSEIFTIGFTFHKGIPPLADKAGSLPRVSKQVPVLHCIPVNFQVWPRTACRCKYHQWA